jgi:hypothetical protein
MAEVTRSSSASRRCSPSTAVPETQCLGLGAVQGFLRLLASVGRFPRSTSGRSRAPQQRLHFGDAVEQGRPSRRERRGESQANAQPLEPRHNGELGWEEPQLAGAL